MARAITNRGTLWTLRRSSETARAEMVEIEGVGLDLRYTRSNKPFVRSIFADGSELLREAEIERPLSRNSRAWSPSGSGPARKGSGSFLSSRPASSIWVRSSDVESLIRRPGVSPKVT